MRSTWLCAVLLLVYGGGGAVRANTIDQDAEAIDDYVHDTEGDASEPILEELVPTGVELGQVVGMDVCAEQRLHVFHRAGRVWDQHSFSVNHKFNQRLGPINASTLMIVDTETGEVVKEHGKGIFYMPHGLTIDGDDNVWITDVALHQVMKFPKGSDDPSLVLGKKFEPGDGDDQFCKPTDVAVASNGDFFVADGYCNSRIMKFDRHGNLLGKFGSDNDGYPPSEGQFNVPHSLTLIEDLNLVCVADRENERIQCFSAGLPTEGGRSLPFGQFITKAENLGRVFAIREKAHYLVGVTGRDLRGRTQPQVFLMDVNNGKANTFAKGLEAPHCVAVTNDGIVFVGEIGPNRIVRLSLGRDN